MTPQQNNTDSLQYIIPDKQDTHSSKKHSRHHSHHHKHHRHHRHKKKMSALLITAICIVSIIALLCCTLFVLHYIGKKQMIDYDNAVVKVNSELDEDIASENDGKTIIYNGKKYVLNENITTILCMGIDSNPETAQDYGNNGQSDANFLLAIDTKSGKSTAIAINRDTMVDANIYGESGEFAGTKKQQLCLAFANGDGGEQSCENMKKCVSSIFYGLPVNSYIAIDIEAIGILNEAVGGVTVTSPETFSVGYNNFYKGQKKVLDTPQAATAFVQWRNKEVLDSNVSRMMRQKIYLKAFANAAISKTKEKITFPLSLYNKISSYNLNDMNAAKITFLTSCVMRAKNVGLEFKNVEGDVIMGEKYAEFTPDKNKLFKLILDVFYLEK